MKYVIVSLIAVAFASSAAGAELVTSCPLSNAISHTIKVTKDHRISDTDVYKLHYAGKTVYFFDNEEDSRGGPVKIMCVRGKRQHLLVAYGEFGAGYPQGFVLIPNQVSGSFERLDFAERGAPQWLYLNEREAIVIVSTDGVGENGGTPYVAYRHIMGKAVVPVAEAVEIPAPPAGYEVIPLNR